jgi:hypothetical protein
MKVKKAYKKKYYNGVQQVYTDTPDYSKIQNKLAKKDAQSNLASSVAGTAGNMIVPGLGTAIQTVDSISTSLTKDSKGLYKSKTAEYLDQGLNPMSGINKLVQGDFAGAAQSTPIGLGLKALGVNFGKTANDKLKEEYAKAEKEAYLNNANKKFKEGSSTDAQSFLAKKGKYKVKSRLIETEGREPIFSPKKKDGTRDLLYFNPNDPTHSEGGVKAHVVPKEVTKYSKGSDKLTISKINQEEFRNIAKGKLKTKKKFSLNEPIVFGQKPNSFTNYLGKVLTLQDDLPGQGYSITPINTAIQTAINYAGGKLIGRALKTPLAKKVGEYLTIKTPLKDAYKLNPFAGKPSPNKYYRTLGNEGYKDAVETKMLRAKVGGDATGRPSDVAYFAKGKIGNYPGNNIVAEVSKPLFKKGDLNPVTKLPIKSRHGGYKNIDESGNASNIPLEEVKVLKKHWLKGYKEVTKYKCGSKNMKKYKQGTSSLVIPEGSSIITAEGGKNIQAIKAYKKGDMKTLDKIINSMPEDKSSKKGNGDPNVNMFDIDNFITDKPGFYPATRPGKAKGYETKRSPEEQRAMEILGDKNPKAFKGKYGERASSLQSARKVAEGKGEPTFNWEGRKYMAGIQPMEPKTTPLTSVKITPTNTYDPNVTPKALDTSNTKFTDLGLNANKKSSKLDLSNIPSLAEITARQRLLNKGVDPVQENYVKLGRYKYASKLPENLKENAMAADEAKQTVRGVSAGNVGNYLSNVSNITTNRFKANNSAVVQDTLNRQDVLNKNVDLANSETQTNTALKNQFADMKAQNLGAYRDQTIAQGKAIDATIDTAKMNAEQKRINDIYLNQLNTDNYKKDPEGNTLFKMPDGTYKKVAKKGLKNIKKYKTTRK